MFSNLSAALLHATAMHAEGFRIPVDIVRAVVVVESGGNTWAWNPEPRYRYLVDARTGKPFRPLTAFEIGSKHPPDDFPTHPLVPSDFDAEWWGQQASWGPMQVMGAVAREYGFDAHFPKLCVDAVGVYFGCRHLDVLRGRFGREHGWRGVIAAYNAGAPRRGIDGEFLNAGYVAKVEKYCSSRMTEAA